MLAIRKVLTDVCSQLRHHIGSDSFSEGSWPATSLRLVEEFNQTVFYWFRKLSSSYTVIIMKTLSRQRLRFSERQQSNFGLKLNTSLRLIPSLIIICWTARTCAAQGTAIPLSEADIQEIVEAHNLFRRLVEPPASNMQRIVSWDGLWCAHNSFKWL